MKTAYLGDTQQGGHTNTHRYTGVWIEFLYTKRYKLVSNFNEDLDIDSIGDIFNQSQIFEPAKHNYFEVKMVKDKIEQSVPFPGNEKSLS